MNDWRSVKACKYRSSQGLNDNSLLASPCFYCPVLLMPYGSLRDYLMITLLFFIIIMMPQWHDVTS